VSLYNLAGIFLGSVYVYTDIIVGCSSDCSIFRYSFSPSIDTLEICSCRQLNFDFAVENVGQLVKKS
jgi:hypothetical protein